MPFNIRKALDAIVPTKQDLEVTREKAPELDQTREEVLAYQFKPGQVVRDKVTGKEVKILAADRGDYVVTARTSEAPEKGG